MIKTCPCFSCRVCAQRRKCSTLQDRHLLLLAHCIRQLRFFQLAAMLLPSPPRLLESQEQHNSTEASDWPRRSRGGSERCDWWKVSWYRLGSRGRIGAGRATCACAPAPAGCVRPAHAHSNTFSNFKLGILYQNVICGAWTYFFRPDNNAVI